MARSSIPLNVIEPATRRKQTILLVEEDSSVRGIALLILERQGYRVLVAASAREALKVWENHSHAVELLFTDVQMNGMGGSKLAEILLSLNPKLTVLFSSGGSPQSVRNLVANHPNVGFLAKPYTLDQLKATVESALLQYRPSPARLQESR